MSKVITARDVEELIQSGGSMSSILSDAINAALVDEIFYSPFKK